MESATRDRFPRTFVAAAILFAPAVGAGVFVGRSIPERQSQVTIPSAGSGAYHRHQQDRSDLVTCQEKLDAQRKTPATVANADASPGDVERDAPAQPPTTVEGLEAELRRCTKSELVVSAEVCNAAARQFEALMALPKDSQMCGPKSRAADLVE